MSSRQKGALFITLSAAGFAFLPTITRSLYAEAASAGIALRPGDVAFWRFLLAVLVLGGVALWRLRRAALRPSLPWPQIVALGGLYAFSAMSAFIGLQYINASLYVVLFYTYPAMLALIYLAMGVSLTGWQWLAIGLVLAGLVLTIPDLSFFQQGSNLVGVGVALFNALSVAIYYLLSSRWMKSVRDSIHHTSWTTLITLAFVALLIPFNGLTLPSTPLLLALLAVLAVGSTVIPILSINLGLRYLNAAQASIISSTEPVMAMLIALVVLHEVILPAQWAGAALIVLAVLLLELSPRRKAV